MNMADVKKMSPSQRVLAMEILWESMCGESDELESPDWHKDILEARKQKMVRGESCFITLQQLKERLAG